MRIWRESSWGRTHAEVGVLERSDPAAGGARAAGRAVRGL